MSEHILKCTEVVGFSGKTMHVPDYINLNQEIIRCRECKWLLEDERYSEAACRFYCRTLPKEGYRDGFCAWAKRKEVTA